MEWFSYIGWGLLAIAVIGFFGEIATKQADAPRNRTLLCWISGAVGLLGLLGILSWRKDVQWEADRAILTSIAALIALKFRPQSVLVPAALGGFLACQVNEPTLAIEGAIFWISGITILVAGLGWGLWKTKSGLWFALFANSGWLLATFESPAMGFNTVDYSFVWIGLAVAALMVGQLLKGVVKNPAIPGIATTALVILISFPAARLLGEFQNIWQIPVFTGLVALIASWSLMPDQKGLTTRIAFVALISLGLATFAFSGFHRFGMALSWLTLVAVAAGLGSLRLIAASAPLWGVLSYRAVRELLPDATGAFEIGQHYALIGLLLGILACLVFTDYVRAVPANKKPMATLFASALLVGACAFSLMFLGVRGGSALFIGLGIAPLISLLAREEAEHSLLASMAVFAVAGLALPKVMEYAETSRETKLMLFSVVALVGAGIAITLYTLTRSKNEDPHDSV